jgi:hypothetical protein
MRLETGGLIDRTHPVRFSFGGDVLTGFSGATRWPRHCWPTMSV